MGRLPRIPRGILKMSESEFVERFICGECDARYDLIETVGESCPNISFCPACGAEVGEGCLH